MNTRKKAFHIETFGCQMNVNDSEKVAGLLLADGYSRAQSVADADVVFINTCAVREKAADKLYSSVGRMKHLRARRPALRIAVGGCVAQLEGESILERAPAVDVLVGTHNFSRIPEMLRALDADGDVRGARGPLVDLDRKADSFGIPPQVVAHTNPVRAFVTAMEGCNHVCSFCVVPRTRGTEVCRDAREIVAEVESLVARGVREVMLLGQTVNAYRHGGVSFADLLARVDAVPGLARLRFTTSHPEHVDLAVAQALGSLRSACPHLHLPVQSGSDRILSSMRRGYTADQYRDTVALLRRHVAGLALTTDIIVGYPGETEEDFERTIRLVEEIEFSGAFVFTYSPRPGTGALKLGDDLGPEEKSRRLQVINQQQQRLQAAHNRKRIGTRVEVLVDAGEAGRLSGRTRDFRIVHFDGPTALVGELVAVDVVDAFPNSLAGRLIPTATDSLTESSGVPIL